MSFIYKKYKKLCWCGSIFFVIIMIGAFLVVYSMKVNSNFTTGMTYDKTLRSAKYLSEENGYIFRYKHATPYDLSCFASVSTVEDSNVYMDSEGNIKTRGMAITLFIWPTRNGYEYGVDMYCNDNELVQLQVYVDKELNIVWDKSEGALATNSKNEINEIIGTYRREIEELMEVAKKKWNIR